MPTVGPELPEIPSAEEAVVEQAETGEEIEVAKPPSKGGGAAIAAGAGAGFLVGGPIGAIVGAIAGGMLGRKKE
jgi:hypothetical protein